VAEQLRRQVVLCLVLALFTAAAWAQQLTQAQEYFQQGHQYHIGSDSKKVDLDKALRQYLLALRANPSFYEAHVNSGKVYYARKDFRRAKVHFSNAVTSARGRDDISPGAEAKVSSDLGGCYYQEGNIKEAERWFRGAVGLDPTLVEAHYNLINLLFSSEREPEALRQMAIATELAPSQRYGIFRGRQTTLESKAESNRLIFIAVAVAFGGAIVLGILRSVRGGGRKKRRKKA
jgi:tetratricopeptide (TPR) repeat protein